MGFKLICVLLFLVGATYAAPAVEEELEDSAEESWHYNGLNEESLDALTEDDDEEDEQEQDEDALDEEDPKRKPAKKAAKKCPAVLKGKRGFRAMIGYGAYCWCKGQSRPKMGDETEISEDDVAEHVENLAEDPKRKLPKRKRLTKKQKAKLFHGLVKHFFKRSDQCCYCTYNRKAVRLFAFLHKARAMALKGKIIFYYQFRRLVTAAVGRAKANAYFKALARG